MSPSQPILHPTDFSGPAGCAFGLAGSLARQQGARLIVLHVPDPLSAAAYREQVGARVVGRPFEKLWRQLEQLRLEAHGVSVEPRLTPGDPATEIFRTAQETDCALIVMGMQGWTGLARLLMGSVAEQVVRGAACPVVTVRADPHGPGPADEGVAQTRQPAVARPIRTILHPTDFSQPCEEAFRVACSLAGDLTARVIVLHVAVPPPVPLGRWLPPPLPANNREKLEEMLRRLQASAPDIQVAYRLADGDPAVMVADVAQAAGCDLIVMGTHGRTGLGRLLMGSVAERVLRTAPCPVMTVKAAPVVA